MSTRFAPGLALALCLGACHASDDASCAVVTGRFSALALNDLDGSKVDDATRRAVQAQLPAMRDSLNEICRESGWSPAVRACLAGAPDHAAFTACELQLTADQRRDLDRAATGAAAR